MTDINVSKIDEVDLKIECDDSIAKELNQFFTFYVPNYEFTPAYKNKKWDGKIRLFNVYSRKLYIGLLDYLIQFSKDRNYTIDHDITNTKPITLEEVSDIVNELKLETRGSSITPYDYQINAIHHAISKKEHYFFLLQVAENL